MALVFVAKDMQVTTPVGNVNIHPLPDLPAGIQYAHLLRHSLDAMRVNLVDGEQLAAEEIHLHWQDKGDLSYDNTSIFTNLGSSGWFFSDWDFPFDSGLTWMAVALAPTVNIRDTHRLISSGDYRSSAIGLLNLSMRPLVSGGDSMSTRIGGTADLYDGSNYTSISLGEYPSNPYMTFGAVHGGNSERSIYVPHVGVGNFNETFALVDPAPEIQGVTVGVATESANHPADTRLYMIAQWNRVLSKSEMDAAYRALKPWLLARGVNIA